MNVAIKQLSLHHTAVLGQRQMKPALRDSLGRKDARDSKCLHRGTHDPVAVPTPEEN